MKMITVTSKEEAGKIALELLEEKLASGAKTLGLATGSTPLPFYQAIKDSSLDFSQITSINLDEYVGLSADDPQSYAYFMQKELFAAKPFKASFLPNGLAADLTAECHRYNDLLQRYPIDFQILGIGRNGHIGFNEPGTSFDSQTHLVDLAPSTIEANSRFFEEVSQVPKQALSMGIASIMAAKRIVLMAFGQDKADALAAMVKGPITEDLPASILQKHEDLIIIADQAAASKL